MPYEIGIAWSIGTTGKNDGDLTPFNWNLGLLHFGTVRTTNTGGTNPLGFVVKNTGNIAGNFTVTCAAKTTNWTLVSGGGYNAFDFGVNTNNSANYASLAGGGIMIGVNVAPGATQSFSLRFAAPNSTNAIGVSQTITLTITATGN